MDPSHTIRQLPWSKSWLNCFAYKQELAMTSESESSLQIRTHSYWNIVFLLFIYFFFSLWQPHGWNIYLSLNTVCIYSPDSFHMLYQLINLTIFFFGTPKYILSPKLYFSYFQLLIKLEAMIAPCLLHSSFSSRNQAGFLQVFFPGKPTN